MPASTRELRRRIRSVSNTSKVTKAMQLIAASKMRRAQEMVLNGRPYSEHIQGLLSHLAAMYNPEEGPAAPLLEVRPVRRTALVLITPDRGLCGGLISNINRAAGQRLRDADSEVTVISVGRRGRQFIVRTGTDLKADFEGIGDRPSLDDTVPISSLVMRLFQEYEVDRVWLGYSRFESTAIQRPEIRTLIPVEPAELAPRESVGYIYEPDAASVLEALLPRYVEMQIYHAILEAIACEHSARMVAMKNATDAANDIIENLTLDLNKARQEAITTEMLDIVGGVAAVQR